MTTRSAVLGRYMSTGAREYHDLVVAQPGEVVLVKSIFIGNDAPAARLVLVYISSSAGSVGFEIFRQTLDSLAKQLLEVWTVLEPGDKLRAYIDGPSVGFWVAGAILPLALAP